MYGTWTKSGKLHQIIPKKSQDYNKTYFDKHHVKPREFKEGDYVMIGKNDSTTGMSKKIIPKMKEPLVISEVLENDRYVVEDIEGFQPGRNAYCGKIEGRNIRMYC